MTIVLQINDRPIASEEIMSLLVSYQLLPQFLRGVIIDRAIASIECTPQEIAESYQQLCQRYQIQSATQQQAWLKHYGMNPKQLEALATRALRIEKFKQQTWGNKLEPYFLSRKGQLDKAIYFLLRTKNLGLAEELYFRIQEREQSFAECARVYSEGLEATTSGLLGPIELGAVHPTIAKILSVIQPGQLWHPIRLEEWIVIVQLEKLIPAQLDEPMRQQLLNELFETWISEQMNQANWEIRELADLLTYQEERLNS